MLTNFVCSRRVFTRSLRNCNARMYNSHVNGNKALSTCEEISEALTLSIKHQDVTALIRTVRSIQETPEARLVLASKLFNKPKSRFPRWFQTWFLDARNDIETSPVVFISDVDEVASSSLIKALVETRRRNNLDFIGHSIFRASTNQTLPAQNESREEEAKALAIKVISSIPRSEQANIVKCVNSFAVEGISETRMQALLIKLLGFHSELIMPLLSYLGVKPSRKTSFEVSKLVSKRTEIVHILTKELDAYIRISNNTITVSPNETNDESTGGIDNQYELDGETEMPKFGTQHRLSVTFRCVRADKAITNAGVPRDSQQNQFSLRWTDFKLPKLPNQENIGIADGDSSNKEVFTEASIANDSSVSTESPPTANEDLHDGYWATEGPNTTLHLSEWQQQDVEASKADKHDFDFAPSSAEEEEAEDGTDFTSNIYFDETSAKRKVMLLNVPVGVDESALKWGLRKCGNIRDVHLIRCTTVKPAGAKPAAEASNVADIGEATEATDAAEFVEEAAGESDDASVGEEGLQSTGEGLELEETGMSELTGVAAAGLGLSGGRNPLVTMSATKPMKRRGSKRIQEVVRSDNHAFVWLADDASYARITRDDMRILGVCLKGETCPIVPAEKQHTLFLEINKMWSTSRIKRFLADAMDYAYELDCPSEFDNNVPVFVQLNFATHEDAWKMYHVLRITNTAQGEHRRRHPVEANDDSVIKVLWVKTKWYWVVAKKEKELIYDGNSLRKPMSESLESVDDENKKIRGRII